MKQIRRNIYKLIIILVFIGPACQTSLTPDYLSEIKVFKEKRLESLIRDDGYLVLEGLYWLNSGSNTFGSDSRNDIVFPDKTPKTLGRFILNGNEVYMVADPEVEVYIEQNRVDSVLIYGQDMPDLPVLKHDTFRWYVIKRGERIGIRLRNLESDTRRKFEGLEYFELDDDWRLEANFKPYNEDKTVPIQNILGMMIETPTVGSLEFEHNGKLYNLDVLDGGEDTFFVIFGDKTNGESTYGAGRYMYPRKPDPNGKVILDFNQAFNPPCAFTEYATCPLPPRQNILDFKVKAGELISDGSPH